MTASSPPPEGPEGSEGPPPPPAAAIWWLVVSYSESVGEPAMAAPGTASATMASAKAVHSPHRGRGRWPTNRFNMLFSPAVNDDAVTPSEARNPYCHAITGKEGTGATPAWDPPHLDFRDVFRIPQRGGRSQRRGVQLPRIERQRYPNAVSVSRPGS